MAIEQVKRERQWSMVMAGIRAWIIEMGLRRDPFLAMSVNSAALRFLSMQAYYDDVRYSRIAKIEDMPSDFKTAAWNEAKQSCGETQLRQKDMVELAKCMYWYGWLFEQYEKENPGKL